MTDTEMDALRLLCRTEGIIRRLSPAGRVARVPRWLLRIRKRQREILTIVCSSGRGDKDMEHLLKWFGYLQGGDPLTLMIRIAAASGRTWNAQAAKVAGRATPFSVGTLRCWMVPNAQSVVRLQKQAVRR